MKLIIKDNYDAMSEWAAQHIADAINNHKEDRPFILGQGTEAGTGSQRSEGLVERNMSVNTATTEEEVNSAVGCDLVLIALALCLKILYHSIENVYVLCGDIDVIKEIVVHKVPIALIVLLGKTEIFVHIERNYVLKRKLAVFVHLCKVLIYAQGR